MDKYAGISIHPLSSSVREKRCLLICNGCYYEVTASMAELVDKLKSYSTEDEAVKSYVYSKENRYTAEQIQSVIRQYIDPILEKKEKKREFLYQKNLLSAESIDRFSDRFSVLFRPGLMTVVFILATMLDFYFLLRTENLLVFNNKVNVYIVAGLFAFMLGSSFFHELGHASACKRFGIRHGGIGFGLYLNFPVLYTDVTEVWKLDRLKRCVVNIAGVYFQLFLLILLLVAFRLTGNDVLRYLILVMNLGFLMTLNPFFKFDGYWLASDLLGVPNLRKRSRELLVYVFHRLSGRPVSFVPYLLQIRRSEKIGLAVYSVVVNLFMGYYFLYIIPSFIYSFACSFPEEVEQLTLYLANRVTPPFALLRNIGMQLLFFGLIGYMVYGVIKSHIKRSTSHV